MKILKDTLKKCPVINFLNVSFKKYFLKYIFDKFYLIQEYIYKKNILKEYFKKYIKRTFLKEYFKNLTLFFYKCELRLLSNSPYYIGLFKVFIIQISKFDLK